MAPAGVGGEWKVGSGEYTWGKTGRKNRKKPEKMSDSTLRRVPSDVVTQNIKHIKPKKSCDSNPSNSRLFHHRNHTKSLIIEALEGSHLTLTYQNKAAAAACHESSIDKDLITTLIMNALSAIAASAANAAALVVGSPRRRMANSSSSPNNLEEAAANSSDATTAALPPPDKNSIVCGWKYSFVGCHCPGLTPKDICGEKGCDVVSHHMCQTEWEIARYLKDCPDDDPLPADCWYDDGSKNRCMKHHKYTDIALEGVDVGEDGYPTIKISASNANDGASKPAATNAKKKPKKARKTTEERQAEKQRMVEWAESLSIEDVQLTENNSDVDTIGGREWSDLKGDVMRAFMAKNKIKLPQEMRLVKQFGQVVAQHIAAQPYKDSLTAASTKKRSTLTKPTVVTQVGTLLRVINVITHMKEDFIATCASHDREDLDTRAPKAVQWGNMAECYNSATPSLAQMSPAGSHALLGHGIADTACSQFDKLNRDEFEACVKYMKSHYRQAQNSKKQSGNHKALSHYCDGKPWMLYLDSLLKELGDNSLSVCVYPELSPCGLRTSDGEFRPLSKTNRRGGGNASDRSMAGSPASLDTVRTKKVSAVEATESAAIAIERRHNEQRNNELFDRMMSMKERAMGANMNCTKVKEKKETYKRKLTVGEGTQAEYESIKKIYKEVKKAHKTYSAEYERIKVDIGYKSPEISDSSSDSDSDF